MSQVDDRMTAVHRWLRPLHVAYVKGPGSVSPLLEEVIRELLEEFGSEGHTVQAVPDSATDVVFTTAPFGEPISWREAVLFSVRRRFRIDHSPLVYTFVHAHPDEFEAVLARLERALTREVPDPSDYDYPGLAPEAHHVLHEQGLRGGPILALERLVQAHAKSIRVGLVVGDDEPQFAYHFDLAGAHPRTDGSDRETFYRDILLRVATAASTDEVTEHEEVGEPISRTAFAGLSTTRAMQIASQELGKRNFFTQPVVIADLVAVPAMTGAVQSQYSEGCFATWDTKLGALVATGTGSARPLDKGHITAEDLTVIEGIRPDGKGARVRPIAGRDGLPPSSEAVEMMSIDSVLPRVTLPGGEEVPIVRSKLHAHRGVSGFDPALVEHVPLEEAYYRYLVSCASQAQAVGVEAAFGRSRALSDADDSRQVVFVVLPGHGVMFAEKWVEDKEPFQVIWELMDRGAIQVASEVPQGPFRYVPSPVGMVLEA